MFLDVQSLEVHQALPLISSQVFCPAAGRLCDLLSSRLLRYRPSGCGSPDPAAWRRVSAVLHPRRGVDGRPPDLRTSRDWSGEELLPLEVWQHFRDSERFWGVTVETPGGQKFHFCRLWEVVVFSIKMLNREEVKSSRSCWDFYVSFKTDWCFFSFPNRRENMK